MNTKITLIGVVILLVFSCESDPTDWESNGYIPDSCLSQAYRYEDFDIHILPEKELPYIKGAEAVKKPGLYDTDSVPLHEFRGKKNYHPVFLSQYALRVFDVHNSKPDSAHLIHLNEICDKLLGISLKHDATLFFPYMINFPYIMLKKKPCILPGIQVWRKAKF